MENKDSKVNPESFSSRLFNHETQQWEDVSADDTLDRVTAGTHTYEAGIQVPVVAPDGDVGYIPADQAHAAFKDGFRPLTKNDQQAYGQRENDRILEQHFGDRPVDAFLAGALRGSTLGLSDVALDTVGAGDAAAELQQRNPISSAVGEGTGMAAASLGMGPASIGAKAAVRGGEALAAKVGTGVAAKAASKIVPAAAEGAYFGIGTGISEVALGNPESVVDSLVSNVGLGALLGGGFGAAAAGASAAKPGFDKIVEHALTGAKDIVSSASRAVGGKALTAALNVTGEKELARLAPELVNAAPEVKAAIMQGGPQALKAARNEIKNTVKQVRQFSDDLAGEITTGLKEASQESQQLTRAALDKAGKNIFAAAGVADDWAKHARSTFDEVAAASSTRPAITQSSVHYQYIDDALNSLKKENTKSSKSAASRLESLRSSMGEIDSVAKEASLYSRMQETLRPLAKHSATVDDLIRQADSALENFPDPAISSAYKSMKVADESASLLGSFTDKTVARIAHDVPGRAHDSSKVFQTLANPRNREMVDAFLSNVDQFAPEISQWQKLNEMRNGVKKAAAQQDFEAALEARMKTLNPNGRFNGAVAEDLIRVLGATDLESKLDKLRSAQQALATEGSPINRLIAMKKTLGQPVSKELQDLTKHEHLIRAYEQLQRAEVPGVNPAKAAFGASLGDLSGAVFGLQKVKASRYLDAIAAVEQAAERGARTVNKAIKRATDVLTSPKAHTAARSVTQAARSNQDDHKRFKEVQQALSKPPKPLAYKDTLPQVAAVAERKQLMVKDFLQSKLPEDPFSETALSLEDSGYVPSDMEISRFLRYVDASDNPMSVLTNIEKGSVSQEEVEALKIIYPDVYKGLQNSVLDAIINAKVKPTYQQKLNLGTLFDIPTDYSLRPEFIALMQTSINKDEGGRPEGTGGNRKIQIDLKPNETVATSAQQLTYR